MVKEKTEDASGQTGDVIEVRDLRCGYGETTILKDLRFSVRAGEIFLIAGPSGCGKSTLMRYLINLQTALAGEINVLGQRLGDYGDHWNRRFYRSIGVLFQGGALWSSMSLLENVALPLREHTTMPPPLAWEFARLKLRQVGLQGFESHTPREISGGMRKRVALARALVLDPKIVFLDEPSAGLDPPTSRQLDQLILRIREIFGTTVVVVSHEIASIRAIADRVLLLDPKKKTAAGLGTLEELLSDQGPSLAKEFFAGEEAD